MKFKVEIRRAVISSDVENSKTSLLGLKKIVFKPGKHLSLKIIGNMVINTLTFTVM